MNARKSFHSTFAFISFWFFFLYLDLVVETNKQFDIFDIKIKTRKKRTNLNRADHHFDESQFNEDEDKGIDL